MEPSKNDTQLRAYISGPLTELPTHISLHEVQGFYVKAALVAEDALGIRGFVPHEHFDPSTMPNVTPKDIYQVESEMIMKQTSVLIVCALAPSWGGGGECQLANDCGIPLVVLKRKNQKFTRYVLGMPLLNAVIEYDTEDEAMILLAEHLQKMKQNNEIRGGLYEK
jgi:hypothetical protein